MRFCPNCRTRYDNAEDYFCGKCGFKLIDKLPETDAPPKRKESAAKRRMRAKKNPFKDNPNEFIDLYKLYEGHISVDMSKDEIVNKLRNLSGELQTNISNCPTKELMEKAQKLLDCLDHAIMIFEKDKAKYDRDLKKAYEEGKVKEEVQKAAKNLLEEIEKMLAEMNYNGVVRKCNEALQDNVKDVQIYFYLAIADYCLDNKQESFNVITRSLTEFHDDLNTLKLGARFSTNEGAYDYAQGYINRMKSVDAENPLTAAEECYLYESMGNYDLAFKTIDDYLEKNPHDEAFRSFCAYDLIRLSRKFYTEETTSGSMIFTSKEDYESCLTMCEKAESIYRDEITQSALDEAQYFGQTEYNTENIWHMVALLVGGLIYALIGLSAISHDGPNPGAAAFVCVGLGLMYSGFRLHQVSRRPYWQINKFILTGKREKDEERYIRIGNIFVFFVKWSFKLSLWMISTMLIIMAAMASDSNRRS